MKVELLLLCTSLTAFASDRNDIVRIDCDSGHVDPSLAGASLMTNAKCIQSCQAACVNINIESDLEACLSSNDLDACLFQLSRVHEVDTSSCLAAATDGGAPTLVFTVDAEDLTAIGDGSDVEAISMIAEITDPTSVQKCSNHGISLGVSTQSKTDDGICRFAGTPSFVQTYSQQDRYIITNITELFQAAFQSRRPLTIFGTFMDATCGALAVREVDVAFSIRYRDGFRPSSTCKDQGNCQDCEAKGCGWCDWSDAVSTFLPSWLPDWDWLEEAREEGQGMCGVNSAVCSLTAGKINTCGTSTQLNLLTATTFVTVISMNYF